MKDIIFKMNSNRYKFLFTFSFYTYTHTQKKTNKQTSKTSSYYFIYKKEKKKEYLKLLLKTLGVYSRLFLFTYFLWDASTSLLIQLKMFEIFLLTNFVIIDYIKINKKRCDLRKLTIFFTSTFREWYFCLNFWDDILSLFYSHSLYLSLWFRLVSLYNGI